MQRNVPKVKKTGLWESLFVQPQQNNLGHQLPPWGTNIFHYIIQCAWLFTFYIPVLTICRCIDFVLWWIPVLPPQNLSARWTRFTLGYACQTSIESKYKKEYEILVYNPSIALPIIESITI